MKSFAGLSKQVLCDNGKPRKTRTESNRSSNSCFNYENTTHYLSLYSRVRVGFARASSASGTSAAGNRRYESRVLRHRRIRQPQRSSRLPQTWRRGSNRLPTNLAPGQQPPAARTTSSSRPTWSARRSDQSGSSWRNKSCCSRCDESCCQLLQPLRNSLLVFWAVTG